MAGSSEASDGQNGAANVDEQPHSEDHASENEPLASRREGVLEESRGRSCSYKVGNIIRIPGKQALWPGIITGITLSETLEVRRFPLDAASLPISCALAEVHQFKNEVPLNATARLREAYKLAQREVDAKPSDVPEVDRPVDDNINVRKAADAVKRVAEIHSRNQFPKPVSCCFAVGDVALVKVATEDFGELMWPAKVLSITDQAVQIEYFPLGGAVIEEEIGVLKLLHSERVNRRIQEARAVGDNLLAAWADVGNYLNMIPQHSPIDHPSSARLVEPSQSSSLLPGLVVMVRLKDQSGRSHGWPCRIVRAHLRHAVVVFFPSNPDAPKNKYSRDSLVRVFTSLIENMVRNAKHSRNSVLVDAWNEVQAALQAAENRQPDVKGAMWLMLPFEKTGKGDEEASASGPQEKPTTVNIPSSAANDGNLTESTCSATRSIAIEDMMDYESAGADAKRARLEQVCQEQSPAIGKSKDASPKHPLTTRNSGAECRSGSVFHEQTGGQFETTV